MYHWIVNMRLQAILECFVDDVIRSQNKSKLWTAIALSKFGLEKRSTAQNVANWTGYQKFKFQFHIQISKFWQVRNLRLPFHFLFILCVRLKQRFIFAKYSCTLRFAIRGLDVVYLKHFRSKYGLFKDKMLLKTSFLKVVQRKANLA